jgi:hypothetical protein
MRLLRIAIALTLCLLAPAAVGQTDGEPLRLVQNFYADDFDEQRIPLSRRLADLLAKAQAKSREIDGPVAGIDFSWMTGAQDAEDDWRQTLRIAVLSADPRQAVVEATFRLFASEGERQLRYLIEEEEGRWVVGDIVYVDQDGISLSQLLEQGARAE